MLRSRGRPIKHPRPPDCPHIDRAEHTRGVCYQCSANLKNQKKKKSSDSDSELSSNNMESPPRNKRKSLNELQPKSSTKKRKKQQSQPQQQSQSPSPRSNSDVIEINVGGKIFTTTIHTLTKEPSLLSSMIRSEETKRDKEGRIFIDRDYTHFRLILNYLRDGLIGSAPVSVQDRLELLQESRFYNLPGLLSLIEQNSHKETPTFLTARPSTKGLFYISGETIKWGTIGLSNVKPSWNTIAMKFEEGKDEVTFLSINIDRQSSVASNNEVVCVSKLVIDKNAKATISLGSDRYRDTSNAEVTFWWEPSTGQYPQLFMRITKLDLNIVRGLDFFRTSD
eukprot:TRINITY_DN6654_c0_g1_i1.p1 TRINITY_DN6654_c0_g1~~TRINITY_DN6654_c0_g1_i1.p1  ORF type:complete len:337 (+),score=45.03 TRINITY_DN6654_c0_g1_i1:39-1049(+)